MGRDLYKHGIQPSPNQVPPGMRFTPGAETSSRNLIVTSALLPIAGAGLRMWRSANEPTRNLSCFGAKCIALKHIDERIEKGEIKVTAKAESVLRDL